MLEGTSVGGLLWRLHRKVVDRPSAGVQYECRRCGRTLTERAHSCPECGASDVARYEL